MEKEFGVGERGDILLPGAIFSEEEANMCGKEFTIYSANPNRGRYTLAVGAGECTPEMFTDWEEKEKTKVTMTNNTTSQAFEELKKGGELTSAGILPMYRQHFLEQAYELGKKEGREEMEKELTPLLESMANYCVHG
jgi:flagellar biosynthesis/type III secretory pathway protein FliH